ncbi:heme exporter protein CcmB [Solimonas sp. K1W22B-7]|uniref:heme exporter protein CcmB n=1 Tax=Solimonas sp. K1W22B-7 TaxID=2303331 RepID=UPI000E331E45|nr:heme exporter protein CcmB [Solimonas sp. K1W22B-7]AXQ29607.1 heme exporter protein CcmB [Solimonas sp. K1W22B-7]
MNAVLAVLTRELRLALRSRMDWMLPLLFFVMVVLLFGLGARPNDPVLAGFAPSILWVGALLSMLLTLDRLFRADYEDGSLEQLCLAEAPLTLTVTAKLTAHWLLTGLPLVLLAAPLALALQMPTSGLAALVLGLALGTPVLSFVGGFAAALTVALPRAGLLLPLLVLPLLAPVLIFGAGAVRAALGGLDAAAPLYFLAAVLVLCITLIPWAAAAALRNAFE